MENIEQKKNDERGGTNGWLAGKQINETEWVWRIKCAGKLKGKNCKS